MYLPYIHHPISLSFAAHLTHLFLNLLFFILFFLQKPKVPIGQEFIFNLNIIEV